MPSDLETYSVGVVTSALPPSPSHRSGEGLATSWLPAFG